MRITKALSVCISLLLLFSGCSTMTKNKSNPNDKTISYSQVIDLSHVIDTDIPIWPGDPAMEIEKVADLEEDGYYLRRFSIGEHSATHINAPNCFHEDGVGIDAYTPESLVAPAVVIDVTKQCSENPDYMLSKDDILAWENENGIIPSGSIVLMYTGWQNKWNSQTDFFNEDPESGMHFPGFDGSTTTFLINERQIGGVGIDTHGVDPGQDEAYATNTQVSAIQGIILECLTNLDELPATGSTIVIGILRLRDGSGTPASVMAFF